MKSMLKKFRIRFQGLLKQVDGQDMVEYALVLALLSMAATTGMKSLATKINTAFTGLGTSITTYTS
jgi:pilus assembly protein Flp/PilA